MTENKKANKNSEPWKTKFYVSSKEMIMFARISN